VHQGRPLHLTAVRRSFLTQDNRGRLLDRHSGAGLFFSVTTLSIMHVMMNGSDPADEIRRLYPPILTTAHGAEMMHCTIGDVRDKVHRKELKAMRWGQQFRFFREEVLAAMTRVKDESPNEEQGDMERDET